MGKKEKDKPGDIPPVDYGTNENVLTHEELQKEELKNAEPEQKQTGKKEKKQTGKIQFELPFAPMGESKTVILYKFGTEEIKREIKLFNKLFEYPKDLSKQEDAALRKGLLDNGFIDISKLDAGTVYNQEEKKYIYSAVHPEHTQKNPINGNISVPIYSESGLPMSDKDGKQIFKQVTILNGIVKTDDKTVYDALLKYGFYSGYKKEKTE